MSTDELRVFSPEEVDLFLAGDRREIDKLILHGLNAIAKTLKPHMEMEEALLHELGGTEIIRLRSAWIDAQITKQKRRSEMMRKVAESALVWAAIAFLGFLAVTFADGLLSILKLKLGGKVI